MDTISRRPRVSMTVANAGIRILLLLCASVFTDCSGGGGGSSGGSSGPQVTAVSANSVTLSWDPGGGSSIAGYEVSYGTAPGAHPNTENVGTQTNHTVTNLQPKTRYYFVVTAYNNAGSSDPSNEVFADTN